MSDSNGRDSEADVMGEALEPESLPDHCGRRLGRGERPWLSSSGRQARMAARRVGGVARAQRARCKPRRLS